MLSWSGVFAVISLTAALSLIACAISLTAGAMSMQTALAAAQAAAAAAPPDVWQVATLSALKGGAAATAAWLLLKLLHQDVVATPVDVSLERSTPCRTAVFLLQMLVP